MPVHFSAPIFAPSVQILAQFGFWMFGIQHSTVLSSITNMSQNDFFQETEAQMLSRGLHGCILLSKRAGHSHQVTAPSFRHLRWGEGGVGGENNFCHFWYILKKRTFSKLAMY